MEKDLLKLSGYPKHFIREMLKAAEVQPDTYPFDTGCEHCGHIWAAHLGLLCPGKLDKRMRQAWDMVRAGARVGDLPSHVANFTWAGTFFLPRLDA